MTFRCLAVSPPEPNQAGDTDSVADPDAAAQVADYGPAFHQLVQLGVPDASGAQYVKLTLHGDTGRERAEMMMYGRHSGANLPVEGNAWLLPGETKGAATLIQDGNHTITVTQTARRSRLMRALIGPGKNAGAAGIQGDWIAADVAKDTEKILKTLGEQATDEGMLDAERWSYSSAGPAWCARILITACHMYRAGHHDEANRITSTLFRLAPEPILLVDQVVNDLADREYATAVAAFLESGDWQAYRQGTQQTVDRFTRGWKIRAGAELLITRIDKQLQDSKPSLTPLKGAALNPEAVAILDAWLTKQGTVMISSPPCWLLGDALRTALQEQGYRRQGPSDGDESDQDPDRITALSAMGMDGFIALTAAATDETLLAARMTEESDAYYDSGFGGSVYGSGDIDPAEAQYAAMDRPCSRGEIARTILLQTLPDPDDDLSEATATDLQSTAHQWWLEHRNDSPSKLARHFMESGSSQQATIALMVLLRSEDEDDAKLVEKHILEAEDITDMFSLVTQYLSAKRGKARPFFETYSKALREAVGDENEEDGSFSNWQVREAGGVDKFLKRLSVYVEDVSPESILADMRKGALECNEGFAMLRTAVGDQPMAPHLPALVSVARQQKTPAEQYAALRQIRGVVYYDQQDMENEEDLERYQAALPEHFAASRDDWTYFLHQEFLADESDDPDQFDNAPTLATGAAMMIEMIYFPQHTATLGQLGQIMSAEELWDFLVDRSKQLVQGDEASEFPSAEAVDEERRNAIRDTLKPMKAEEILTYHEGLTLNEKLAWGTILNEFGEDTPAGVADLSNRIVKIHWPPAGESDDAWKKDLKALTDAKILDASVVEGLINLMLDKTDHFQDLIIYLQNGRSGNAGIVMSVVREGQGRDWKSRILQPAYQSLRDGKAKKAAGIYTPGPDGDTMVGLRFEPAQKDLETEYPIKAAIEQIARMIDEGDRFYAALVTETAENLKKREAEQEHDPELDLIPGL